MSIKLLIVVFSLISIGAALFVCFFRPELIKKYLTAGTNDDNASKYVVIGLALGAGLGAALGNVGLGVGWGLAIGSGIGYFRNKRELKKTT